MNKILDLFSFVLKWLSIICLASLFFVISLQVFSRYFMEKSPSWTEELARFFFIHAIGFAAPLALRFDLLVKVDFIEHFLSNKVLPYQKLITRIFNVLVCFVFLYTSYYFFLSGDFETSVALLWPMTIPFSAMFFAGIFLTIFSIERLYKEVLFIVKELQEELGHKED